MKPNFLEAHFFLGKAYFLKGELKNALATFENIVNNTPDSDKAIKEKAKEYIKKIQRELNRANNLNLK
ncbi:MAG: hypothetical protein ACOC44_19935 [Promethearchaeia archaeon]